MTRQHLLIHPRQNLMTQKVDRVGVGRMSEASNEQDSAPIVERHHRRLQRLTLRHRESDFPTPEKIVDEIRFLLRNGKDGVRGVVRVDLANEVGSERVIERPRTIQAMVARELLTGVPQKMEVHGIDDDSHLWRPAANLFDVGLRDVPQSEQGEVELS